jgi:hypothetical protein
MRDVEFHNYRAFPLGAHAKNGEVKLRHIDAMDLIPGRRGCFF